MAGIDLLVRDPKDLNSHVMVEFEDVLGEPDGLRSHEYVWYNAYQFFTFFKKCCYIPLTFCCGLCIAMEWGIELGGVTCRHVWCFTPTLRMFAIECACWQRCVSNFAACCLENICMSAAYCCSRINVTQK